MNPPLPYIYDEATANCGPASLGAASGLGTAAVIASWGGTFRGDRSDSPLHHSRAIRNLGLGQKIVTCGDILAGRAEPLRTVILIHGFTSPTLNEHWVVLDGVTVDGVWLHMGDGGEPKHYSHSEFEKLYAAGVPTCCAYTVGQGEGFPPPVLTVWELSWCWVTTL